MVWKLDRLGRSLPHLLSIVTGLRERGVAFRSLTEQMDTATPHGEWLFSREATAQDDVLYLFDIVSSVSFSVAPELNKLRMEFR